MERSLHTQVSVFVLGTIWASASACVAVLLFLYPVFTAILGGTVIAAFVFVFARLTRVTRPRMEKG
jgi:hypothetical protein